MRLRFGLFTVSVLLFICGIGFIIAAERTKRTAPPPAPATEALTAAAPVATVGQLMTGMITPAAEQIWESVSVTVTASGTEEKQPRTDEEWAQLATNAALLVESSNLLLQGDRLVDREDWPRITRAMADASRQTIAAANAKSPEEILKVGETLYNSCTECHAKYLRN